ncbi:hypothetical protein AT05_11495 [Schleiferia thermophila str. Yellowstone]|nr:hypothetical protein AT05_11495 [Schleiferia thermophila str. Yellowstone]
MHFSDFFSIEGRQDTKSASGAAKKSTFVHIN